RPLTVVVDDGRHREVLVREILVVREIFRQHRVGAVFRAARKQIAAAQVGRDDLELAPLRRLRAAAAAESAATTSAGYLPLRDRVTLQRAALRRRLGLREMEDARL